MTLMGVNVAVVDAVKRNNCRQYLNSYLHPYAVTFSGRVSVFFFPQTDSNDPSLSIYE